MSNCTIASNAILDYNLGLVSYSVPTTWYVGLSTTTINVNGTGATEPSGGGYARVAVTNNKTNFSVASSAALTNATAITYAESTASWGTVTHIFLADALTAGNIWYFEALSVAKTIQAQTTALFQIGALTFSIVN